VDRKEVSVCMGGVGNGSESGSKLQESIEKWWASFKSGW
jgi:hypothetical protein